MGCVKRGVVGLGLFDKKGFLAGSCSGSGSFESCFLFATAQSELKRTIKYSKSYGILKWGRCFSKFRLVWNFPVSRGSSFYHGKPYKAAVVLRWPVMMVMVMMMVRLLAE